MLCAPPLPLGFPLRSDTFLEAAQIKNLFYSATESENRLFICTASSTLPSDGPRLDTVILQAR